MKNPNNTFRRFHNACCLNISGGADVTCRVFRVENMPKYSTDVLREAEQVLDGWYGEQRSTTLCLACETRLSHRKAPPSFVIAQPYNESDDDDTTPSIISGVCSSCSRKSDGELSAIMGRNMFPDIKCQPISPPGNA
jgi:hypothetical protein